MIASSRRAHLLEKHAGRYFNLKYINAKDVLPPDLLSLVQSYTCGALIYVPKKEENRVSWGQLSGAKEQVHHRNVNITEAYRNGVAIADLMEEYCLSEASIRKIIYSKGRFEPDRQHTTVSA